MADEIEIDTADELKSYYHARMAELEYLQAVNAAELSDDANHVYRFNGSVTDKSARKAIETLARWHRADKKAKWTFIINSPGGYCTPGLALYDDLVSYSKRGGGKHKIKTVVRGQASSMGSILLQAGDVRVAGNTSKILIHEPSAAMIGSFGELADSMNSIAQLRKQLADIYIDRSNIDPSWFSEHWSRQDWTLTAKDALLYNLIDKIG